MLRKCDAILAGLEGQGVTVVGAVIADGARRQGLFVHLSENRGRSRRGGTVQAIVRLSERAIQSPAVAGGGADLVLALDPLEAVRQLPYLSHAGILVTAVDRAADGRDHQAEDKLLVRLHAVPGALLIEAARLADDAGSAGSANVLMLGAACHLLPLHPRTIEGVLGDFFRSEGECAVRARLRAFRAGRDAVECVSV